MKKSGHRRIPSSAPVRKVALLGYNVLNVNGGWTPSRRDEYDGGHDWEFRHTDTVVLDNGDMVCRGSFSASCHTSQDKMSEFVYFPSKGLLCIIAG